MFRGQTTNTVDGKGRLAVPPRFREILQVHGDGSAVITRGLGCLMVFPMNKWKSIEEKAAALPTFDLKFRDFVRHFISPAVDCFPDKQGRILIPANLREYAKLEGEAVLAGMIESFEIWDRRKWEEKEQAALADESLLVQGAEHFGF
jgi:MraZ protein